MLTPKPFDLEPHHHGQQPGRVRRGLLRDHRRRSARPSITSASPPSAASARSISSKIKITGDVTLDEAKARAKGFKVGLIRVEKYFEGTQHHRVRRAAARGRARPTTAGAAAPARSKRRSRSCASFDKTCDEKMPRMHVVFGAYDGPDRREARREGRLHRRLRQVEGQARRQARRRSRTSTRIARTKDPHTAKHSDIFGKMLASANGAQRQARRTSASRAARSASPSRCSRSSRSAASRTRCSTRPRRSGSTRPICRGASSRSSSGSSARSIRRPAPARAARRCRWCVAQEEHAPAPRHRSARATLRRAVHDEAVEAGGPDLARRRVAADAK